MDALPKEERLVMEAETEPATVILAKVPAVLPSTKLTLKHKVQNTKYTLHQAHLLHPRRPLEGQALPSSTKGGTDLHLAGTTADRHTHHLG